jgi:hypothetical protein
MQPQCRTIEAGPIDAGSIDGTSIDASSGAGTKDTLELLRKN